MLVAPGLCVLCVLATVAIAAPGHRSVHSHKSARSRACRRGAHHAKPRRCHGVRRAFAHTTHPLPTTSASGSSTPTVPSGSGALPSASTEPSAEGSTTTQTAAPTPSSPARAQVTAVEFKLMLSRSQVQSGKAILEFVDGGQDEHNLHIRPAAGGPDVASFGTIRPGQHVDQQIELAPGTYTFYCSLPGHEALGMKATFTVTGE